MGRTVIGLGCLLMLGLIPGADGAGRAGGGGHAGVAGRAGAAGRAGGSELPEVSATTLTQGTMADRFTVRTSGPSEFVVKTIVIAPGGSTGWHYHPGPLIAVVRSGTLTHYQADCRAHTYRAGQALVEPSGSDEVHLGRNLGAVPVVLYATYVDPAGAPLAVAAADPGCGR
jgi:quercetin dioxygenase-like cupin family protein